MSDGAAVLFDDLGPSGRRYVRFATAAAAVALAALVYVAYRRFEGNGQLDAALWRPLTDPDVIEFILLGLANTAKAAVTAMVLSMVVGVVMALGRLAVNRPARWSAGAYVEWFRAVPLLLVITYIYFALPQFGITVSAFWALVLGLTLYNGAMLAEIFRAGILSLDRGQSEAAMSLGMSYRQAMISVIIPQAGRRMIPAILSQLVALLKDTALGYIITYDELLRRLAHTGEFSRNQLQMYLVGAVLYFVVNFTLSRLARRLEVRQRRRYNATPMDITAASEDVTSVAVESRRR